MIDEVGMMMVPAVGDTNCHPLADSDGKLDRSPDMAQTAADH